MRNVLAGVSRQGIPDAEHVVDDSFGFTNNNNKNEMGDIKISQWAVMFATKLGDQFDHWHPHGARRMPVPASHLNTHTLWLPAYVHSQTQK